MNKQRLILPAAALAILLVLAACGGGSGDSTSSSGSSPSSATSTTTQGVITGFGSVFVDGVEFSSPGDTSITMDGSHATESDLQVGMLVTLQGTVNADGKTGTATSISYADRMEGVVTANTITSGGTGTLTIMGQTVTVTADTVFDSKIAGITTADLIQVGNIVEVSGYASSTGEVIATRIEVKAASQTAGSVIEVKGLVANLDTTLNTFTLGSLTVDYSGMPSANLLDSVLADGQYVEVKSTTVFNAVGPLIASNIELKDDGFLGHEGHEGEDIDVRGLVTVSFANNQFELNGRTILIDSSTKIENGTTAQLVTGAVVKVHTHFNANGQLVADKIEFKNSTKIELEGSLQAIDLTLGTITVMGQVIYIDNNTLMFDKSDSAVRHFSLSDLNPGNGDHLEINAYQDTATGHLIATKLERKNFSNEAKVNGPADISSGLVVAGISIDTSTAMSKVPAFSNGTKVEVAGVYSSGVLHASKISLDD
jgi:hypothetical protein